MITPSSPVTGGAQTGFTSPTYTFVTDVAPDTNGKQFAVTAIGGTQAGVDVSSVSRPFTFTFTRPKNLRVLGQMNPVTGLISNVPNNTYKGLVRKGVLPLAGQPNRICSGSFTLDVPAGADTADPANVRACISLLVGMLSQLSAGFGDTAVSGTF